MSQMGSQPKTSFERSSGTRELSKAGAMCSARASGVQPSLRCTERTGRGWLKRKISFLRTQKIWPLIPSDASLARKTASGEILFREDLYRTSGLELARTLARSSHGGYIQAVW